MRIAYCERQPLSLHYSSSLLNSASGQGIGGRASASNVRPDREPVFLLSCVLRIPDCVRAGETAPIQLLYAPEKSLFQMGFRSEAFLGRLDGLTGRSARARDLVRLGKKILGASGETGGWAKAAGVGAAGGAQAQSGAKRGMNSCDALLCILSVSCGRAESIKVARSGANCRVNSCAALRFLQKFLRIGAACRGGRRTGAERGKARHEFM